MIKIKRNIFIILLTVIGSLIVLNCKPSIVRAPDEVSSFPNMKITYIKLERQPVFTNLNYDDVEILAGKKLIKGTIHAEGYHTSSPVKMVVYIHGNVLITRNIRVNTKFQFALQNNIPDNASIRVKLFDRHGNVLSESGEYKQANWQVTNEIPKRIDTEQIGTALRRNLTNNGQFRVINAPNTGLSFMHEMHYNTTLQMEMHKTDVSESSSLTALGRSINPIKKFTTDLMIPTISTDLVNWAAPQGSVIHNGILYVVYEDSRHKDFGRIVSFDLGKICGVQEFHNEKNILRILEKKVNRKAYVQGDELRVIKSVKVSSFMNTGHGQAFSYNTKTHSLWLISLMKNKKQMLTQINPSDFSVIKKSEFYFLDSVNNNRIHGERNLAIQKNGDINMISVVNSAETNDTNLKVGDVLLYHGRFSGGKLHLNLSRTVIRSKPGYYTQFLSMDNNSGRLFYLTDGAYLSIPAQKWAMNTLLYNDINMGVYATEAGGTREFESQVWWKGRTFILTNRGAELMVGTK